MFGRTVAPHHPAQESNLPKKVTDGLSGASNH